MHIRILHPHRTSCLLVEFEHEGLSGQLLFRKRSDIVGEHPHKPKTLQIRREVAHIVRKAARYRNGLSHRDVLFRQRVATHLSGKPELRFDSFIVA